MIRAYSLNAFFTFQKCKMSPRKSGFFVYSYRSMYLLNKMGCGFEFAGADRKFEPTSPIF